jgi:ATP-dependent DNA helicase RecG
MSKGRSVLLTQKSLARLSVPWANDLPDRRQPGVLFIGVRDDGSCGNVQITEQLVQRLLGFRTDGNILPPPVMSVRRHILDGCTMAIVEVQPSIIHH